MGDQHLTALIKPGIAMKVTRVCTDHDKLVYVIQTNRKYRYKKGTSRIAYIGSTKNGVNRITSSAAHRADSLLEDHGIHELEIRVVTCRPRQKVKTWRKLERALLLCFKQRYGEIPRCNTQGKNMMKDDEFEYFRHQRIKNILETLS